MIKIALWNQIERTLEKMVPIVHELIKNKEISVEVLLSPHLFTKANQLGINGIALDKYAPDTDKSTWTHSLPGVLNYLRQETPDIIVLPTNGYFNRCVSIYAKMLGIKVAICQIGTIIEAERYFFVPNEAHCFLAWNEPSRRRLIEYGFNENQIILTGAAHLDTVVEYIKNQRNEPTKQQSGSQDTRFLLIMPSFRIVDEYVVSDDMDVIATTLEEHKDVKLYFKTHPANAGKDIEIMKHYVERGLASEAHGDILGAMYDSSGVVLYDSTLAYDACVMSKPLFTIVYPLKDYTDYAALGVAISVKERVELKDKWIKYMINLNRTVQHKSIAELVNYKNDGHAAKRVCDELIALAKGGK